MKTMKTWQLGLALAATLAAAIGAQCAEAAAGGYVHSVTGSATLKPGDEAPRPLNVGALLRSGDVVTTGDKGAAVVKLEDGQVMLLGAASSLRITEYSYAKTGSEESRAVFGLLKGTLRVIGGALGAARADVIKIAAGSATVGIGGTDATLIYDPLAQTLTLVVNTGVAQLGTLSGERTIEAGAYSVASRNAIPALPAGLGAAPAPVQLAASTMLAMQNVPPNTPVSVEAAARAAASPSPAPSPASR
jgi:hypothetical protein